MAHSHDSARLEYERAGWQFYMDLAEAAFYSGESREAIEALREAVRIAGESGAGLQLANSLNRLGVAHAYEGQYHAAEPLFHRAIALYRERHEVESPETAAPAANLSAMYLHAGNYENAEQASRAALEISDQLPGRAQLDAGRALDVLGDVHTICGERASAVFFYRRALASKQHALGPRHVEVAVTLKKLGALLASLERYAEAEPLLWRALKIREQALGSGHPALAGSYAALADLYGKQGKTQQAQRLLKHAAELEGAARKR